MAIVSEAPLEGGSYEIVRALQQYGAWAPHVPHTYAPLEVGGAVGRSRDTQKTPWGVVGRSRDTNGLCARCRVAGHRRHTRCSK